MFGLFHRPKSIPASERERVALIRGLLRQRFADDQMAQIMALVNQTSIEEIDDVSLLAMPEGSILRVVEHYLTMKRQGVSDPQAIEFLHEAYSAMLVQAGINLGPCPPQADLSGYIRFFVQTMYGHGPEITDVFIESAVHKIVAFYS